MRYFLVDIYKPVVILPQSGRIYNFKTKYLMTLEYFLDNSNKFKVPKLPNGELSSLDELYEILIKYSLPKESTVEKWHSLLIEYVQQKDAIFFIRRYASASNKQWDLIRRGFLTEYSSGLNYVFCDNYFAHYFYLMALNDFTPTIDEFNRIIKSRKFPYGFMGTSNEKPFQAFPKGKSVNINSSGWKLAHLYSVNQNDYNFDYKKASKNLFPIGNQIDWKIDDINGYPVRIIDNLNTEELRKITIAHFLRLVHPINYFLVPKTNLSNINIGEAPEVISFMRNLISNRYEKTFTSYEKLIMSKKTDYNNNDISFIFNLKYGFNFKDTKSIIQEKIISLNNNNNKGHLNLNDNYSSIDLSVLEGFLINGLSFRSIERDILKIDSQNRGGGFIAKKIINSYGIQANDKGTVTQNNIETMIINNEGEIKITLIKLNEHIKNCH